MEYFSLLLVDDQHWNNIAKFRRFSQRIGNDRLIFIDEIAIYAIMAPGHQPLIIVEKPSVYAERYDFIGAINGSQAINRLCINNAYLICDKSRAHNRKDMIDALKAGQCKSIVDVCYMPTASAKYGSSLDNPICHKYKEVIRSNHPITSTDLPSLLSQTFLSLSKQEIKNAYRKCAIVRGAHVFDDQPLM